MTTATEIQMVPVDAITVLNPRARNRRVFHELITSTLTSASKSR